MAPVLPPSPADFRSTGWSHAFDGSGVGDADRAFVARVVPAGGGPVLVVGAAPAAWVAALLADGRTVIALDASRPALEALLAVHSDGGEPAAGRLTPLHGDPRDLAPVPGLAAVLLPPPLLAALGTPDERRAVLENLHTELADPAARAPRRLVVVHAAPPSPEALAGTAGPRTTTAALDPAGRLLVRHVFADGRRAGSLLAPLGPEEVVADLLAAGFRVEESAAHDGGFRIVATPGADGAAARGAG